MESPTPLSENNLRRYKGIRASKKSLYSCTDFYLKTEDEEDEALGPRSVSLSALVEGRKANSAIEPTRMSQLETLEKKMASIEVSLATVAAAQQGAAAGAPTRRKRNGMVGTARSLHSSLGISSHNPTPREFQKELDFMKQSLRDKENLILNLQGQLRKLSKKTMAHGSITSTDSGVVSLRILSENERKAAEERLAQLDKDMEIKRGEIKRITLRLERLDPSDNIDIRIQQAELEYELEREELNLMNLQEERRNLHTILDDNDAFQKRTENSLFTSLPLNTCVAVHSFEVVYDASDPPFIVGKREDRSGTYITWTREDLKTLKRGDRLVEMNGTMVISKGVNRIEEFWSDDQEGEGLDLEFGTHPLRIVVMRAPPPPPPPRAPNRELHALKEELILVTAKLEQVSCEKKDLQGLWGKVQKEFEEVERIRQDGERVAKDRDLLRTEGVRLKHRISYLEDQVADLLQQKEATPSPVTVFQKGNHKTIVAQEPNNKGGNAKRAMSPTNNRPPSVASSKNCETRQALKTRLWETFRRATSSDSRSVCSVESSKHEGYNYFKKRHAPKEKERPPPPSKPLRLSLQRATSTSEVYGIEVPDLNPGPLKRSNFSENTLLPDYDVRSEASGNGHGRKKRSGKHGGIRWPSLRPASSMSYAMGSRNTSNSAVANFY